ncbi:MAG: hypothetical protein JWP12_3806 [Bacteroidetes bacterium]|nr:hypothetical protein [Bacteroidota bacterium]
MCEQHKIKCNHNNLSTHSNLPSRLCAFVAKKRSEGATLQFSFSSFPS